jgi:hypothetical protein
MWQVVWSSVEDKACLFRPLPYARISELPFVSQKMQMQQVHIPALLARSREPKVPMNEFVVIASISSNTFHFREKIKLIIKCVSAPKYLYYPVCAFTLLLPNKVWKQHDHSPARYLSSLQGHVVKIFILLETIRRNCSWKTPSYIYYTPNELIA